MLNQLSRILLLSILFSITVSNFAVDSTQQQNDFYSLGYSMGIGTSLSYKDSSWGSTIDLYNIFHFRSRPFDKLLIKLGVGFNYNTDLPISQMTADFSFATSIGYLYIQNQYHPLSKFKKFGAGVTIDYTMNNSFSHSVGASVYAVLNRMLFGIGVGAVFTSERDIQPYVMSSLGFTF